MNNLNEYIDEYKLGAILLPEIRHHLQLKKFKKGEFILNARKPVEYIYFLVEGIAEVNSITLSGNKIFIDNLLPLELFGDLEYINQETPSFDVVAMKDTICILLPFKIVEKHFEDNAMFWKLMAKEGNKKLSQTNRAIILQRTHSLRMVLSSYLIKNDYTINFEYISDLAAQLNVSYRNLSRVIKALSDEGIIKKEKHKIITLDREKLDEYSVDI